MKKTLIYAHRGTSLLAPENTQPAFDLSLAQGADVLEIDVRVSRDDQVIVTHDATVNRTTDGRGKVIEHTLAELKKLDAGCRFEKSLDDDKAGSVVDHLAVSQATGHATAQPNLQINHQSSSQTKVQLLTLDELFAQYPNTPINIDVKDATEKAAERVADCIANAAREANTTVGSFHQAPMKHFRQLMPQVRSAALKEEVMNLYFRYLMGRTPPSFKRDRTDGPLMPYGVLQIPVAYFKIPLATPGFVSHVKALGLEICFWTLNDADSIKKIMALGVTGIVTDRADLASKLRKELGQA